MLFPEGRMGPPASLPRPTGLNMRGRRYAAFNAHAHCAKHVIVLMQRGEVARLTGLEPATPGVTGRYSNQLSYNRA